MLPELFKMHLNGAVLKIKEGIFKFKEWKAAMMDEAGEELKMIGLTDDDVDRFMDDYWNTPFEMDGESHTISEWAGIYGNEKLREKIKEPLNEKYQKQMAAEPIKVKVGDMKNIEETLPYLLPQQQEDVLKAETQFFGKKHADRDHAYGKGYMFTNGTGTGKTYTGLGIAKRLAKQDKGRILFVTPSQKKVSDWVKDGKNLGLDIRDLDSVAKEKGTTATTESGEGMVITTYANMRANKKLLETEWDAVIYDESHRIMENKKGAETTGSQQHYMLTNRDENHTFLRLQSINKHYQKMQSAADKFNALRQKEIERIQKEYKQSHPSATVKDIINATYSKQPKDLHSFAPADGMTFPKLGKAYQDYQQAKAHYYNNVEPKLKEQAKQTWKNTKTVFLSATPFNTRENLDYAEGYIFKFPENNGNGRIDPRSQFYLDHFGAAYRFRYNRLEAKTDNPDAVAKQEIAFSDYLQNTLGTMSGRIIDSAYDYSRDFPTVAPDHAEDFNNATQEAMTGRYLGEAYRKTIGNYNYGSALFETMKIANIIGRMKEHLDAGRKIVVFHRRVETKEPIQPPFAYMLSYANAMIKEMKPGKEKEEAIAEANEFRRKYADLLQWEQTLDYSMPREQIAKAFGKDNVLFFSGKESKGAKSKAVDVFNDDNSGKNIIVIQEASGKEGISLHDTTGNHQRVLITLGLPQSPITALQIEGRTYRIGNKSNAIFEYPILGLNSEMMLFGEKFNNQVSTTENLALGSKARNLRDSFANGVLEHSGIVPIDQQGVGGKEFDAPKQSDTDPFDDAVLDYYSNQKLNKRNREGVDYFPTPEPLGYKMVEWANMGEGDTALEPSAGHGAIARYIPRENQLLSIEPSQSLFTKLQLKAGGLGRKFLNNMFENYDVSNKHDVVVMNPPFGTAGATAIAHLDKAFRHLDEGGRVVAIIPRGSTDKKFDKWYDGQKNIAMRAEVDLPDIVFQQAGTSVRCRVVVLDKITDAALRSKAGYPEKIDLSGHYDKIEDFFEDLRDVQIPDRIIDTQLKDMKKARTFKKELESIKGISVNYADKNGISVFDKNCYRDYSITFPSGNHSKEWLKENYSKVYEQFDQTQQVVYSENSKAALEEMKKLACKLADMSEDEMQKYIGDRKNGGTHFREERGVQYSETDAKDVKKGRIIPEDVDKAVSSQIEKKFDDEVERIYGNELTPEERDEVERIANRYRNTPLNDEYSTDENGNRRSHGGLETAVRTWEERAAEFENYYGITRETELATGKARQGERPDGMPGVSSESRGERYADGGHREGYGNIPEEDAAYYRKVLTNLAAAKRALEYHQERARVLSEQYGVEHDEWLKPETIERIFKDFNADKNLQEVYDRIKDQVNNLGIYFGETYGGEKNVDGFYRHSLNDIRINLDRLVSFGRTRQELASTILHEMLHPVTSDIIGMFQNGHADKLTEGQKEAAKEAVGIYNELKQMQADGKIGKYYALTNAREMITELASPEWRNALAKVPEGKNLWQRLVNSVCKMFGFNPKYNKLGELTKTLDKILTNFGKEQFDFASKHQNELFGKEQDMMGDGRKLDWDNEEDRNLFDSLKDKRNTRKEYNDTVTELARRMAEGNGNISDRTTGGMEETERSISSRREDRRGTSMGRTDAGINLRHRSVAHCAADIIAHDIARSLSTERLSRTRAGLDLGQKGSMEDSANVTISSASSDSLQKGVASVGERDVSSRLENWAKQNNTWFDWRTLRGRFDRNERLGTGDEAESDVFLSKDGKSVLKIVRNPHAIYDTLSGKLDSIAIHNELFPNDAMEVIGFTKINEEGFSTTSLLLEQPFAKGKTIWDSFDSNEKRNSFRNKFMEGLGFTKERWVDANGWPDDIWRKGDYAVEDVNAGNVIIDENGNGHIIDCVAKKYNDAIKDKVVYDSTEEKKEIAAANKIKLNRLQFSLKNEKRKLVVYAEARNENNKTAIDRMLKEAKAKVKDLQKQIASLEQNDAHFRDEKSSAVKLSDKAPVVVKHIANVAEKVGGKVNMVQSAEEVTNPQAKKAIGEGKKITGWYDEKTGEVHLYMPNIHDRYTAEKTIWHEVVGHKGMRELFGEDRFDKFLDSVWYDLDKPENASLKKLVMEEMQKNPLDYRNAIEEGVARLAEEGRGDAGFWRNIKNKVTDFLHEIGYRIAPNTKDVKYLLWLSKNLQKNPNDPYYKMRAEAVKYHIDHEDIPAVTERGGMFHDNTGRIYHDMSELPKAEYQEMTDGKVHFRTTPSTSTALDRYDRALNAHGYMATESFMDNMLSLKELMMAVDPSIKKIEDVKSSENPYILQNTMQGAMSNAAQMFERNVMKPLDKAMADVLDAFDGKKDEEKIRNFNLYMITKHGLERNRVFFVRDYIGGLGKQDAEILQKQWDAEKKDLGDKLRNGSIDLKEYYEEMDEWIRNSVDKDFKAEEHDYSGMHGLQEIDDNKAPYDDAAAIQSVMDSEANMESVKAGSVKDFWSKVHAATSYSLYCDYANGFQSRETYTKTSQMFDWYVPLRKFDEQTAEDVYGYVTEKGDPSGYIGSVLMSAKGRKSLSEVNVLAQIGAMGNMAISNGGKNAIKQAFMRFARSHDSQGLITEGQVWLVKDGTNADGSDRWVEAYPQIPDGAAPKTVSNAIRQFEADMKAKQATGNAKIMRNAADIGYKFERAKDKSQHVVDVKVNGKTHRFYINGNPRAAQALNGMLENKGSKYLKPLSTITRTMAQLCTSFSPEFVVRNIVRDMQFASSNVTAKEGARYGAKWGEYYAKMLPIGAKNISIGDIKGSTGLGLYAKYRNGTLDMNNTIHKYFKEFMENGGETGWVQVLSMKDWEKKYKRDIKAERSKLDKGGKAVKDFFFGNLENLNEAAENMARFATYCTSRDYGRSAVRSAYDAKEVSTNFNRHGSGDSVWSFKNGEMGGFEKARRGTYGFIASYLRQCSMFFNAGIQSTNLLKQNFKAAPKGTITAMMGTPFALGALAALVNNWMIANEDEKDRNGVKDPYAELPDYIRRNDLCIYKGGGEFVTIPLAIELRAFYGLGDLAAGMTFAKNIKSTRYANLTGVEAVDKYLNPFMDAVGCISQLVPVMDYTNSHAVDKNPGKETLKALTPSAASPLMEWWMNSDWKGAPIRRETTSYNEYAPAWQRAYKNTPQMFMNLNKKVNAMTNDVAPGNEDMLGNGFLDAVTNPAALNHYLGGFGGGAATFGTRLAKLTTADKVETNDVPFLRSFLYKPNEQSSMQRMKSKWYNYVESMEKTMSNLGRLKSENVPIDKRLENLGAYYKFKDSKEAQMADIIERAQKYMKKWKQMRDKSSDATAIDNANENIDLIMQDAVEELDKLQ